MSSTDTRARAEFVAGLRAFADLVEMDPTIPTPGIKAKVTAYVHRYDTGLSEYERFDVVHDFADAYGIEVTEAASGNRAAEWHFGPVHFRVVAFADARPEERTVTRPSRIRAAEPATV